MAQNIVIIGSGFAGTWAALAAARAVGEAAAGAVTIRVVSPQARLCIRPRLYEAVIDGMDPDVGPLLAAVGVEHVAATVTAVDVDGRSLDLRDDAGGTRTLAWDRLVLAAGSELHRPHVPGLAEHAFDIDQLDAAERLARHLAALAGRPPSEARNAVVIGGGGFTGIEAAAEMPARLRAALGAAAAVRVVVVEQAAAIGPDLGPGPRPVIEQALAECGVEIVAGHAVAAIDADGVTLDDGTRIAAATVVWTGGARAHPLAAQIPGQHDAWGRVHADPYLRAPAAPGVFVTGDVAHAASDDEGNVALMSCQHALSLGRVAGYNAAADLLGLPLHPYRQPKYVTCLDLGPWGAVYTEGWDRQVCLQGAEAKALKRDINTLWIYPPPAEREAALATATPDHAIVP
ncbi:MAG: FAD-dependent oxidoreductase [Gammaproteobacteria bacterium]|nr:FAD-dependent oxidoreductase [Gammaproteobacteria bacterium]